MTKDDYISLCEKCLAGNCNDAEIELLEKYQDEFSLEGVSWDEEVLGSEEEFKARVYSRLSQHIKVNKVKEIRWYTIPLAAAIAIITLGTAFYFYINNSNEVIPKQKVAVSNVESRKKAILVLDNGSQVSIDEKNIGVILHTGNTVISKEGDGKLIYDKSKNNINSGKPVSYNTIIIPKGAEYQLTLSDGTKVWLNASSRLRFPVEFVGSDRKVELVGEAYFEVQKDNRPFRVSVKQSEVTVLGTHFNVNAYGTSVNTTLLEGSVKLSNSVNSAVLLPGQLGISHNSENIAVSKANIEAAIAWKNGFFVFHNESIEAIMSQLSNWYDIDEVIYRGDVKRVKLYGKISRYETLDNLLESLELTGVVNFKTENKSNEGRRITVMP